MIVTGISAAPLPWLAYVVLVLSLLLWSVAEFRRESLPRRKLIVARSALAATCLFAAALELPFHFGARLPQKPRPQVAVIADSVTAGIGEGEAVTWPRLISRRHEIEIRDLSAMGATVTSALKQAAQLHPDDSIVVIEIGGNDMLGGTSSADFAAGLDALLQSVTAPGRTVVMFELPLPPTFNSYGLAQRRLARRHGVMLIPKRALMGVLTGTEATLDSIHLSQSGHEQMSEVVWQAIGGAYSHTDSPTDARPAAEGT